MGVRIFNILFKNGNPPFDIDVDGDAQGCDDKSGVITVELTYVDANTGLKTIDTKVFRHLYGAHINWKVSFLNINCKCNSDVEIYAWCGVGPQRIQHDRKVEHVVCGTCPVVNISIKSISDDCFSGKRKVTIEWSIIQSAGQTSFLQWDFGDGTPTTGFPQTGSALGQIITHDYLPGSYKVKLLILFPTGCQNIEDKIDVLSCGSECCPNLDIKVTRISASDCVLKNPVFKFDSDWSKSLCPPMSGQGFDYYWTLDGPTGKFQINTKNQPWVDTLALWTKIGAPIPSAIVFTHIGQHTISVVQVGYPSGCLPSDNEIFTVVDCCPSGQHWDPLQQKCVPDEQPCPDGYHKNEQGECVRDEQPCPDGYHKNEQGECVPDEQPCPDGYHKNERGECVPNDNPEESSLCGALRWLIAFSLALALTAFLLGICVPPLASFLFWVAGGAIVVAIGAIILYLIFCPNKPCNWFQLLLAQVLLSVGYVAMCLSNCCIFMLPVGLVFAIIGIVLFITWKNGCKKTWCEVSKEAASVLNAVIIPVISYILLTPLLQTCVNTTISTILSTLVGILTIYAINCKTK
ncbi:MAG: hypothetical protein HUU34_12350 [Saprospiraceae bacterium]|nr:hypothetical protein [Saprospiraceae bacterium]